MAVVLHVCADADPQRGFTLLETVLVLVLVSIILALALPSYSNYTSNQRTLAAARTLKADLGVASLEAVARRTRVTVGFTPPTAACGSGAYSLSYPGGVLKQTCLPPTVEWVTLPDAPLIFESAGGPRADRTVTLRSARTGRNHWVAVTAGTGAVTSDVP